jgi:hypothetical protein
MYEFTDLNYYDAIAIKGYDDVDGYLVYHIAKDSAFYHGAYYNFEKSWQDSILTGKDFLVKRLNWSYAYFKDSTLVNLDKFGNESNKNNSLNTKEIYSVKNTGNILVISLTKGNPKAFYSEIIDNNNLISKTVKLNNVPWYDLFNWKFKLFSFIIYVNSNNLDYSVSGYYEGRTRDYRNIFYNEDFFEFNKNNMPFMIFKDFIRIDNNTLIFVNKNQLTLYRNSPSIIDSNNIQTFPCELLSQAVFNKTFFASLIKLNDTCFCVAGSYDGSPAYYIINKTGDVIDSCVMSNRYGCFEYVSETWDGNLLFSGYRNKYFEYKSPYFVKIKNIFNSSTDDSSNETILQHPLIFPNPTSGRSTIRFAITKPGLISLKIYNEIGLNIYKFSYFENVNTELEIPIDISAFGIGLYYYIIEFEGKIYSGKIVHLNN